VKSTFSRLAMPEDLRIVGDRPGQRAAEAGQMGAAVALRDVVCERQYGFVVAVVPPHRDLDADAVLFADHVDRLRHHAGLRPVDVFHEFPHAAFVEQLDLLRLGVALVLRMIRTPEFRNASSRSRVSSVLKL
jgi:hypothetical protein